MRSTCFAIALIFTSCAGRSAMQPHPVHSELDFAGAPAGRVEAGKGDLLIASTPQGLMALAVEWTCLTQTPGDELRFLDGFGASGSMRVVVPRTGNVCIAHQLEQPPLMPVPLARTEADVMAIAADGVAALLTLSGPKVMSVREGCKDVRASDRLLFSESDLPDSCISARVTVLRTGESCELWCG